MTTKKALLKKREEIKEMYSMGLLTPLEYSKMLDLNFKMLNSKLK